MPIDTVEIVDVGDVVEGVAIVIRENAEAVKVRITLCVIVPRDFVKLVVNKDTTNQTPNVKSTDYDYPEKKVIATKFRIISRKELGIRLPLK